MQRAPTLRHPGSRDIAQYASLSLGSHGDFLPFARCSLSPSTAWLRVKLGKTTAPAQCQPVRRAYSTVALLLTYQHTNSPLRAPTSEAQRSAYLTMSFHHVGMDQQLYAVSMKGANRQRRTCIYQRWTSAVLVSSRTPCAEADSACRTNASPQVAGAWQMPAGADAEDARVSLRTALRAASLDTPHTPLRTRRTPRPP